MTQVQESGAESAGSVAFQAFYGSRNPTRKFPEISVMFRNGFGQIRIGTTQEKCPQLSERFQPRPPRSETTGTKRETFQLKPPAPDWFPLDFRFLSSMLNSSFAKPHPTNSTSLTKNPYYTTTSRKASTSPTPVSRLNVSTNLYFCRMLLIHLRWLKQLSVTNFLSFRLNIEPSSADQRYFRLILAVEHWKKFLC